MKYRIKIGTGKMFNPPLGEYYIEYFNGRKWKIYKEDSGWPDGWKTTCLFPSEQLALEKIAELVKQEIKDNQTLEKAQTYIREIDSADIARILLENDS